MSRADDLTPLLAGLVANAGGELGFRTGEVAEWNAETGANSIIVGGAPINDVPFLSTTEGLAIRPGDVVGMLAVKDQMFVLGRISVDPGGIVVRDAAGRLAVLIERVEDGGQLVVYHANGQPAMLCGPVTFNGQWVGRGWFVQQSDGTDIIGASAEQPGGPMVARVFDPNGSQVLRTDPGGLLARPYLPVPVYPVNSTGSYQVTGLSEQTVAMGQLWVTHGAIRVIVRAWVSSGVGRIKVKLGAAETDISNNGLTTNSTGAVFLDFGWLPLPASLRSSPYSFHPLRIVANGSAGAVTVHCVPYGVTLGGLSNT